MTRRSNSNYRYDYISGSYVFRDDKFRPDYKDTYEARKRREDFQKFLTIIGVIIATAIFFCLKNFIRDMNKFKMWKEGIRSILILFLTNIVTYSIFAQSGNYESFLWGIVITFTIFCIYWHIILHPKNKLYNATIWQQNQYWWQFDGWEFEKEVGKLFKECGYDVEVTKGSGDGGVDIILNKGGVKTIVQCKHYQAPVSVEPIRALWGCMYSFHADEAIFIASSGFTSGCFDFIKDKPNYKFLTLEDLSLMAAQLQGKLDTIYNKNNQEPNKFISLALPLYLLIGAIILTSIYFREYEQKAIVNNNSQQTTTTTTKLTEKPVVKAPTSTQTISNTKQSVTPKQNVATAPVAKPTSSYKSPVQKDTTSPINNTYSSPNKSAAPNTDTLREPDFGPYLGVVQRRVKDNWDPPKTTYNHSTVVLFRIAKDGRLLSSRITKSSGIREADQAALRAIEITAPFRPLPADFTGQSIDVQFTLDYNVYERARY